MNQAPTIPAAKRSSFNKAAAFAPPPAPNAKAARNRAARFRKLIPWVIGIGIVTLIALGLMPKPLPVETGAVNRGPLAVSVLEEGKTRIRHRFTISPPVGGYLQRVQLRAGDPIEAGVTELMKVQAEAASLLNPRLMTQAQAAVKGAEFLVKQREADVERARAAADLAEREKQRAVPLHRSGAISASDWDQADLTSSMRQRELHSAEFGVQTAKFDLQQAQAALLQAEGNASPDGTPLTIVSPVTGFVLNVFEESARLIAPGTPVMEVGDPTDLEAEIELLSTDAAAVKPGAEAIIERWGGVLPIRAIVQLVEPAAFTKISALGVEEQRVKVRVEFREPHAEWARLGDRYRVEARIVTWSSPDVLQIPTGALFRRGSDWICFVIDGGRARLQKLEIGHNNGIAAEVLSGITARTQVILHPPDAVVAGARVKPRDG